MKIMIFSRLYIQDCLNILKHKHPNILDLTKTLNSQDAHQALAAMWEVVLEAELSKLGQVELEQNYEEKYATKKTPDILFNNGRVEFLADIKCISDKGEHEENPIDRLKFLIYEELKKIGLKNFGIDLRVESIEKNNRHGSFTKLTIPNRSTLDNYFYKNIKPKLNLHANFISFNDIDNQVNFTLKINLETNISTGSYPSYTVYETEKVTSLFSALTYKRNYDQIKWFKGFKGFIVADGGARIFHQKGNFRYIGLKEVCIKILESKPKIDFIVAIWIEDKNLIYRIFFQKNVSRAQELLAIFETLCNQIDHPIRSPDNALSVLKSSNKYDIGNVGGYSFSRNFYKFSVRDLHMRLAGKIDKYNLNEPLSGFHVITSVNATYIDNLASSEDYNIVFFNDPNFTKGDISSCCEVSIEFKDLFSYLTGEIDFISFQEKMLKFNKIQKNIFLEKYESGHLLEKSSMKDGVIYFCFSVHKSVLISDFI